MKNNQGYIALVTVLIISGVALAIAATVSLLGIGVEQSALTGSKGENALQLAEGCAEDALLKSQQSSAYNGGTITRPEGTCIISVSKSGNNWTITATSTQTDYNRTVQVNFVRTTGSPITLTSWQESLPVPTPTPTLAGPPLTTFMDSGGDATGGLQMYTGTILSSTGTVGVVSSPTNTGPDAIKSSSGTSAGLAMFYTNNVLSDSGSRVSFYVNFASFPSSGNSNEFFGATQAGLVDSPFTLAITSSGALQLETGSGTPLGPTGAVLSPNQWYRIAISYVITNTTTYKINVYVNGTLNMSLVNAVPLNVVNSNVLNLGWEFANKGNSTVYYDDIYTDNGSDLSDPGNIHVTAKRPFANGFANSWATRIGSGSSGYGSGHAPEVNERPINTANGWSTTSNLIQEYYTVEGAATGDVNISSNTLIADQAWIYLTGTTCSGSLPEIMNNNVLTGFTMPTTPTMITNYAALSSYPSSNEAVGVLGCGINPSPSYSLYEAGLQVAYK